MKFKVNYIDGQDNVFKSFYTEAVHARACLDELYLKRGNFDHKVISILCPEEGLLYEFGDNQAVNRAVLEPAEALKLYGNGPKITLPEPVPSEITGEMFAKELSARLKNYASNHVIMAQTVRLKMFFRYCMQQSNISEKKDPTRRWAVLNKSGGNHYGQSILRSSD